LVRRSFPSNLTTRSGTNALGGSVSGFLRNESLNASSYFAPRTEENPEKPRFRRNQAGFVLDALSSNVVRRELDALGGYDTAHTGEIVE
jgi:hypothetical protein